MYYNGKNAPKVTAAASVILAQEIIDLARQHEIPLFENKALLDLLLDIGVGEIPERYIYVSPK